MSTKATITTDGKDSFEAWVLLGLVFWREQRQGRRRWRVALARGDRMWQEVERHWDAPGPSAGERVT